MLKIKKKYSKLWLYFSGMVLATVFSASCIIFIVWIILFKLGVVSIGPINLVGHHLPLVWLVLASLLIGVVITVFVGKLFIKPMESFSDNFEELSKGNFSVRASENELIKEINDMAKCFNSMVNDLSHIETLRNDFVENVSHEFKTPIASIEGYATLLQDENLSEEKYCRYVQKILDNSARLSNLTTNILALSKLDNQESILHKSKYRLDEQVRKALLLLENKWAMKNLEFDIDMPKYEYFGDEQMLDQVWFNIIDNAIKHSNVGDKIKIALTTGDGVVYVSIADQGCGMSEEVQKHLFEKFYQGDTSRKDEGNGLGLSIVKRIVDLCDGDIKVESAEGIGTKFIVTLPDGHMRLFTSQPNKTNK